METECAKSETQILLESTSAKLQRRLQLPLIVLAEEDGINVLLLSRCHERSVQRRAFFAIDGQEEVSVHGKHLPAEILTDIFREDVNCQKVPLTEDYQDLFVQRVVTVVRRLRSYEVCVGVDDS